MKKRLYLFSFIVLPLALTSCNYQSTPTVKDKPTNENINVNQNINQNNNTNTANVNAPINTNTATLENKTIKQPLIANVNLSGFAFSPKTLTIKRGTTVVWTNQDSVGHTITSDDGSIVNSTILNQGDKYQFTFNSTGTFNYYCSPHPNMTAKIIVTE